ncbi:hypothetical protein ACFQ36_02895 [Arthrobacter sp. GCM10027362]|uniref:hypothetical protein n=1 Tax=Arthrobacter sp. GCM10027362 TaxID=3273379 RepID=UPI00362858B6
MAGTDPGQGRGENPADGFAARVGQEIDRLLRIRGKSPAELAALLGLSGSPSPAGLAGNLNTDELAKVAWWLGVPVSRLLGGRETE